MDKFRIYSLVASFISAILAVICWYFFVLITCYDVKDEFMLIKFIVWFLMFVIAFGFSVLIFIFLFFPFFESMGTGGAKAHRNKLIFFLVLLCFPLSILIFNPALFIRMSYSWITSIVFGYGAIHSLILYLKEKEK